MSTDPVWDARERQRRRQNRTAGFGQALQGLGNTLLGYWMNKKSQDQEQQNRLSLLQERERLARETEALQPQAPTVGDVAVPGSPLYGMFSGIGISPDLRLVGPGGDLARQIAAEQFKHNLAWTPGTEVAGIPQYTAAGADIANRELWKRTQEPNLAPGTAEWKRVQDVDLSGQRLLRDEMSRISRETMSKAASDRRSKDALGRVVKNMMPYPWQGFSIEPQMAGAAMDSLMSGSPGVAGNEYAAAMAPKTGLFEMLRASKGMPIELPDAGRVDPSTIQEKSKGRNVDLYAGKKLLSRADIEALFSWFQSQSRAAESMPELPEWARY
jgi:hypothetical protein